MASKRKKPTPKQPSPKRAKSKLRKPRTCGSAAEVVLPRTPSEAYDRKKERSRSDQAEKSRSGRDIGPIPPVADPARREACRQDAELFLTTYFPHRFSLAFSDDHRELIATGDQVIRDGGQHAYAMPRGMGKTSIAECLALRASLYGFRLFTLLVGASKPHASGNLEACKAELEGNDLLLADFPEVCFPIRALEGISNRAKGQLCQGRPTRIGWTKDRITLPTIPGSAAAGATIRVTGIGGGLRGMKSDLPLWNPATGDWDMVSVRPDLALVDDPQTDESAGSPSQCEKRERLIDGAILGLAGPKKKIAVLMPCTVIRRGDIADRFTDRKIKPEWLGVRKRMMVEFPVRSDLWDQYAELRMVSLEHGGNGSEATAFYAANRAEMDKGARVSWPDRHNADELSAIQSAMNLRIRSVTAFEAEYQNQPAELSVSTTDLPQPAEIQKRLSNLDEAAVPLTTSQLVGYIDVQHRLLYWAVQAIGPSFTTNVSAYGAWPKQNRAFFTLANAKELLPGTSKEEAVHRGLTELLSYLFARKWLCEDGAEMKLTRVGVDASDGTMSETIRAVCRSHAQAASITPCTGRGIGPGDCPIHLFKTEPGARIGHHWIYQRTKHGTIELLIDSNYWKSALFERLAAGVGAPGSLTFWGRDPSAHRMISEHLNAETCDRQTSEKTERTVDVWSLKPGRPDNHLLDCLVGGQAIGSLCGALLPGQLVPQAPKPRRKRQHKVTF